MMTSDLILGFTGSQRGTTVEQRELLVKFLGDWKPAYLHLGDCIGADSDAYQIVQLVSPQTRTVGHPPDVPTKRAFHMYDEMRDAYSYLERNKHIVDASMHLLVTPAEYVEVIRSGTWSTMRYAIKKGVPYTILWPNGEWVTEDYSTIT